MNRVCFCSLFRMHFLQRLAINQGGWSNWMGCRGVRAPNCTNGVEVFFKSNWNLVIFSKVICQSEVEKILKGSLDLISLPSPSVKIQIKGKKVCLRRKGKTLLGIVKKLFSFKSLLTTSSSFCLYTFPAHNLNFHWKWRDRIQAIFLNPFQFMCYPKRIVDT